MNQETDYSTPKKYLEQWPEYQTMTVSDKKLIRELLQEFTTYKCREVARNVRHKAAEMIPLECSVSELQKKIMNIQFKDVKSF